MIRIDRKIIQGIESAACAADLHVYLQKAVELEHSTIPPYLTALFSLKPGTNRKIAELTAIRNTIADLAQHCQGDHRPECPILEVLDAAAH